MNLNGPWDSPGKNTGMGRHSLLQAIFPTRGLNPGLLHCRLIVYHLIHQGPGRDHPGETPLSTGRVFSLLGQPSFYFQNFFKSIFKGFFKKNLGIHIMFAILNQKFTIASLVAQLVKNGKHYMNT